MDEYIIPENILRWYNLASPPYSESSIERITNQRSACPLQKLFFDQLLDLAGLDGLSLYPASTPADYRRLLHAIYSSDVDRIKRDCFFYYLLKDQDQYAADGDEGASSQAEEFARKRCLPRMWRVFMTGYWSLDHSQWDDAVDALSDPALRDINFLPSILHVLSTQVSPPSHALSLLYTLLSGPHEPLVEDADRDIQLLATCSAGSIPEAFAWIRTHESPEVRVSLRESAWSWMLGVSRIGPSSVQAKALKELLHIPLLPEENAHLAHFLAHPPRTIAPPALSLLHDLVTLRFIHQGQYAEALQLDRDLAGSGGKEEDRQRRREMVREFIGVLPEAQRRVLLLQSDELAREKEKDIGAMMNGFVEREDDVDMTAVPMGEKGTPAPVDIPLTRRDASAPVPASPAPQPLPRAHQSPFGGPPRFPSIARTASQVVGSPLRNLSASPFRKPSTVIPSPSIPKPPRQIIDDDGDNDDENSTPLPSRSRRSVTKPKSKSKPKSGTSASAPSEAGTKHTETAEPTRDPSTPPILPRRSERIVSNTSQATSKHASPPPPPASPPSKRTSNRKGVTAVGNTSDVPGAFPTSAKSPATATPGRNTRSASRAILDDHAPPPKRSKAKSTSRAASEAPSEVSTAMTMTPGRATRRSTRRAATAQPASERGSPTPSVAASAGGRSTRGVRSRVREASATPRAKRTRK